MRYLSVCSGIEAASVAWHPLGWTPVGFSEIEPFPCSVLAHRFPNVPNYGDMTTIAARIDSGEIEAPDILVGGTPCQTFSVAGKRESLNDERGGLSLAFIRIADAIDRRRRTLGLRPCIIVWENVPGVLSTKDNAFGHFLAGIAGEDEALVAPGGRWTDAGCVCGPERNAAWRILCAQWFGLAQRRERVFLVASAGTFDPGAVLLEWEGVRRDSAPSREAREGTTADAESRPGVVGAVSAKWAKGTGGPSGDEAQNLVPAFWNGNDVAETVTTTSNNQRMPDKGQMQMVVTHALRADGFDASEDGTGRGTPLVAFPIDTQNMSEGHNSGGLGFGQEGDPMFTLGRAHSHAVAHGIDVYNHADTGDVAATHERANSGGTNTAGPKVIAFSSNMSVPDVQEDVTPCLKLGGDGGNNPLAVTTSAMQVRRLTPRECERLQGFPDDWTLVPHRGKPAADGPRYKAIGNSMAVNVMAWIGSRIDRHARGDI